MLKYFHFQMIPGEREEKQSVGQSLSSHQSNFHQRPAAVFSVRPGGEWYRCYHGERLA